MVQDTGILGSFLAAVQASLSVLLVISYGAIAAHLKLLDGPSGKSISKISVKMFLPALLLTSIGSELHGGSAHRYAIILLWAFVCHFVSFLIGIAAHFALGCPDWITAAIMFNNTTSYPLLLIQSLDATGILSQLIIGDEPTRDAIKRAKSYFLVFATVSSCLTFAVGPRLIDSEHAPEPPEDDDKDDELENGDGDDEDVLPNDRTGLLDSGTQDPRRTSSVGHVTFFPSRRDPSSRKVPVIHERRPSVISKRRWLKIEEGTRWWLLFLYDFLNAPLVGAVLGTIIGLVPVLYRAFFNDTANGGIFTAWLTASLDNIGSLFVPLPVVVAGVSLYTSIQKAKSQDSSGRGSSTLWISTAYVLFVRFILWSALSIGVIYLLAKRTNLLSDDPMLWFAMMLMPTGPPAMKLITMVEVSDASEEDEAKIVKLLTISYIISPVMAFIVVGALRASEAAIST